MMTFEQFKTCVRAYFPNVRFYDKLVYLFPNDLTRHLHNNDALVQLCEEFKLPYARILIRNFWKAENLVIGFNDYPSVDKGYADYSYSFSGNPHCMYDDTYLLRLLKLAHDSNCFHYNTVK